MYKTFYDWSRDILNFDFIEKNLGIVSQLHFVYDFLKKKCFPWYILLSDQISFSDCLYFLRYWATRVLELFVNQQWFTKYLRLYFFNSSFHAKWHTTGKVQFLFLKSFFLMLTKFLFWQGDWALGYYSMKFKIFLIFSNLLRS